jgi:hypothetical protein
VVIIRPDKEESEYKSSVEARDAVFTVVNLRKKGIQVTANRQIRGNGLVVETTNPEGLKAFTENAKLKEGGLKASTPHRKKQRMIMYEQGKLGEKKQHPRCKRHKGRPPTGDQPQKLC